MHSRLYKIFPIFNERSKVNIIKYKINNIKKRIYGQFYHIHILASALSVITPSVNYKLFKINVQYIVLNDAYYTGIIHKATNHHCRIHELVQEQTDEFYNRYIRLVINLFCNKSTNILVTHCAQYIIQINKIIIIIKYSLLSSSTLSKLLLIFFLNSYLFKRCIILIMKFKIILFFSRYARFLWVYYSPV